MIQLFIGIFIGVILIPILVLFWPSTNTFKKVKKEFNLKNSSEVKLNENQSKLILKGLHDCTDLYWLNTLFLKFWYELSESNAQAYRLKQIIKKYLDDIPGTGIIRSLDVLNIDIGKESPIIKKIRIIDIEEYEKLFNIEKNKNGTFAKKNHFNYLNSKKEIDTSKVYKNIFENVQSLFQIQFNGLIKIDLKINFPRNLTLHTRVFLKEFEGEILLRFPSIENSTRLEYTLVSNPKFKMEIDAGVSKGESEEYFKQTISTFLMRTVKFSILKTFVYPSFNTLYLPLIVPNLSQLEHKFEKVTSNNFSFIDKIKESITIFMALDYKKIDIINDIIFTCNSVLINNREKIYCTKFKIPECALNYSNFSNDKNFLYEKLTIKESKIMNHIYDFSIFKGIITSFKEINIIRDLDSATSLLELVFLGKKIEFIRIVLEDSIIFQRNDEDNPEFLVFVIRNKVLFIYSFITSSILKMSKSRMIKLKQKLEMKFVNKITFGKLLQYSKNAFNFLRYKKINNTTNVNEVREINIKNDDNIDIPNIINCSLDSIPVLSYKFDCEAEIIFNILLSDDVRINFISEKLKIFKVLDTNNLYKKIAVESKDNNQNDFILFTFYKNNKIFDMVDQKKIVFVTEDVQNELPKNFENFPTNLSNKNKKIFFLDDKIGESLILPLETKKSSTLNVFADKKINFKSENFLYESIFIRIVQQKIFNLVKKSNFERLELKKELRKDFYGGVGGVFIEFKTEYSDDFNFTLFSTVHKKNILDIQKIITSRPVKLILPLLVEDILLLKLKPKFRKNKTIDIKVFNLPDEFQKESLIDCNIGLSKNGKFSYPIIGSPDCIIFWEKDKDDIVKGQIESPYTKVPIFNNGTMRTDKMNYSVSYKNKGPKCRELKIFMGVTKKIN